MTVPEPTARHDAPRPSQKHAVLVESSVQLPRELQAWDYVATGTLVGTFYLIEFTLDGPSRAHWTAPVPVLDRPVREALVFRTRSAREGANITSDYLWYGTVSYAILLPIAAAAWSGQQLANRWDFLWRTEMINVQAFTFASLLARVPHKVLGRTRPDTLGCANDPAYSAQCGTPQQLASFPGGHLTISATGAGLACAHHLHGRFFGGVADTIGCAVPVIAATGVFFARLHADRHWVSDNIAGAGFGWLSGYVIPTLFYYQPFWDAPARRRRDEQPRGPWFTVMPSAVERGLGVSAVGRF